jgi:hypothetical protein
MAGSARPTSWSLGRSGGDHAFGAAVSDLTPRGPRAEPDSRQEAQSRSHGEADPWDPRAQRLSRAVRFVTLNRRPLQGDSRSFFLHRAWPFVVEHGSLLCAVDRLTAGVWSGWRDAWRVSLSSFPSIDSSRSPGSRCGRWDPGRRLGCGRRIETQFTTRAARVGRTPARDSSRNRAFIDRPGGAQETARSRRIG